MTDVADTDPTDTTDTPVADHADGEVHVHTHPDGPIDEHEHGNAFYIKIAIFLAVVTGAEVLASYLDLGPVFIPLLLAMMALKFYVVVAVFMHLRFDNRIFTWCFYTGLFLALGVYTITLFTFRFFQG